ncbi:MAG: hypothetical protein VZQ49_00070 [Methanobrevibacter sp.]|nr:hypothetical protein [Methanobrevibacter sp.]
MNGFDISTASDIRLGSTTVSAVYYGSTKLWPSATHDYSQDYLTFETLEPNTTIYWNDTRNNNSISYSGNDGSTWNTLTSGSGIGISDVGTKILFKASGLAIASGSGIGKFSSSGNFNAMGNIMSLVYGDNFANQTTLSDYHLRKLFSDCTTLVDASNLILPATTIGISCYYDMFQNCSSLTTTPELPANTLANYCYNGMFYNCTSLTAAPVLPATTLSNGCYGGMFRGCTSLTAAPVLPATTLSTGCYSGMFRGCTSLNSVTCLATDISASNCTNIWLNGVAASGTFVKAASMSSWTTGDSGIPTGWTVQNAS